MTDEIILFYYSTQWPQFLGYFCMPINRDRLEAWHALHTGFRIGVLFTHKKYEPELYKTYQNIFFDVMAIRERDRTI